MSLKINLFYLKAFNYIAILRLEVTKNNESSNASIGQRRKLCIDFVNFLS